jgi:hypothetical protein
METSATILDDPIGMSSKLTACAGLTGASSTDSYNYADGFALFASLAGGFLIGFDTY